MPFKHIFQHGGVFLLFVYHIIEVNVNVYIYSSCTLSIYYFVISSKVTKFTATRCGFIAITLFLWEKSTDKNRKYYCKIGIVYLQQLIDTIIFMSKYL